MQWKETSRGFLDQLLSETEKRFQSSKLFSQKIWILSQDARHEESKCSQLIIFRTVTKMATNTPHTKDTAWVTNKCCKRLFSCDRIRKLPPTTLCTQSFLNDSACSDFREPWFWISVFGPAVANEPQQRRQKQLIICTSGHRKKRGIIGAS